MRALVRHLRDDRPRVRVPWPTLSSVIAPGPGHLVLAVGAAGSGKSMFGLLWALEVGAPALVLSFDTDLRTQAVRTVAALSGREIRKVEHNIAEAIAFLESADLRVRFSDLDVGADEIEDFVLAETEYWGEPPGIVVVDNVRNLVREESPAEFARVYAALQRVAKHAPTMVLALHHVHRGRSSRGNTPISLDDAAYGGETQAPILLGLWAPQHDMLHVGVVKNRFGRADPSGSLFIQLERDFARARLAEISPVRAYAEAIKAPEGSNEAKREGWGQ